jgi:hexulose-6-phosphate isomerase
MSDQQHIAQQAQQSDRPTRRAVLATAALGAAALTTQGLAAGAAETAEKTKPAGPPPGKRYPMKKSINLWAFPYPDRMSLRECLELAADAGFDAVELNYDEKGDISPEASAADLERIGQTARKLGLQISGVCSFLFWSYPLTSNDAQRRQKGMEYARKMVAAARDLGTKNLLVVPGAVYIPWAPEETPVPNDVCHQRATAAVEALLPDAEKSGVSLNIENIFGNGFLMSPAEMCAFIDSFQSEYLNAHFDTGNTMQYQFPEHWIPLLGKRIRNVHLKEYSKKAGTEFSLESFRPLLNGTTNWPAVLAAFDAIGYRGYLTFEYFTPYPHWPEALIYQTSDAMDRMLGRKA